MSVSAVESAEFVRGRRIGRSVGLSVALVVLAIVGVPGLARAAIAFVQVNYATPQTAQSTVSIPYPAAQSAGNLNVVIVGWNDSVQHVQSVTDSNANVYLLAVGPTARAGFATQAIYYAANIAAASAGANVVTVTFDGPAAYADIRVAEYSGIATASPVDVVAAATGNSASSSSGSATTTNANDLIVGANTVQTHVTGPGTGFTRRVITVPDGDILEDRVVSAIGSYSATAPLESAQWIMQMVALRAAGGGTDTTAPTAPSNLAATAASSSQINLSWTASTDNVGVSNYLIERCAGTGCTGFAQIATSTATTFSNTGLTASTSYSYRVRATDAAGNLSGYSNIATMNTQGADVTPPAVSITAPTSGATVAGTFTLTATASDAASGVAGLQFQIDGVNVGTADTASPYTMTFNSAQFANGSHTVGAYAWDTLRNVSSVTTVPVSFANATAGDPAQTGYWSGTFNWPFVAIHSSLMYTGKILMWDGQSYAGHDAKVWDPVTNAFVDVASSDNIFCAGLTQLPDGRVLVTGGHVDAHVGLAVANIFDPASQSWTAAPPMTYARWYPTNTTLPDGRILVTSGETNCDGCDVPIAEIYNATTNSWSSLTDAPQVFPYYPHMYVLPDGRILAAATSEDPIASKVLNLATQTWSTVDPAVLDGGSSAMYLPGKIIKSGTPEDADKPTATSSKLTYVLDMTANTPAWRQVGAMQFPRAYHTLTVLPDGNVLATGGGRTGNAVDFSNAVYEAELWSPASETWTTLGRMNKPRLYHSTAVLLPDARVLITGGGRFRGDPTPTEDQLSAEIFAPPYLFKGPRPVIGSVPSQLTYGQGFSVQTVDASRIAKVVLIGLSNVTHTFNMNQRYVPMTFSPGAGLLSVVAPANSNIAPPGYYLLFIVDTSGIPSVAAFVKL